MSRNFCGDGYKIFLYFLFVKLADRIIKARNYAGISQAELARRVNVRPQSVQQWESGVSEPRRHRIEVIAKACGISKVWLEAGVGPMTKSGSNLPLTSQSDALANRFRLARKQKGLTQAELAKRVEVTHQSIQKIEDGQTLMPRNLIKMAEILDVSAEWLLTGDPKRAPSWFTAEQAQTCKESQLTAFDALEGQIPSNAYRRLKEIEAKVAKGQLTEEDVKAIAQVAEALAKAKKSA